MLLLKWLHQLSKAGWSLSNMVSMLRMNLFTYRDLLDYLDDPFKIPPILATAQQLFLAFAQIGQPTAIQRGNIVSESVISI